MNEIRRKGRQAEQTAAIQAVVDRRQYPDFVDGYHLRFGADSNDEPAVWIVFHTRGDLPRDSAEADRWVAEMGALANEVRDDILESVENLFPYFRFEPAEDLAPQT
jgi:hypothetical protein